MSPPVLRAARSTDAGAVGAILSAFIDDTAWMPRVHTRAEDLSFAGDMIDRGWVTVAEANARVAGFAARDGAEVHALYLAAGARRQGIGSALLRAMQAQVDALNLWTFQANQGAQAFYAAHGFVPAETTDGAGNDQGLPDLRMTWKREAA
ncbi:N-acetyltransferase family protein [Tateyamaria sp.]|uniref:GNAT family N-acetyltransferase n=1 Tax=Tateyamaria sp. TaxID=1929288 RepID=UPI003B225220